MDPGHSADCRCPNCVDHTAELYDDRELRCVSFSEKSQIRHKVRLPAEILLSITTLLEPPDLLSVLRAIPIVTHLVGSRHLRLRDGDGNTITHLLAATGEAKFLESLLIVPGCKADSRNAAGQTPLMLGVISGQLSVVQLLMSRTDVNPDATDSDNRNALLLAAQNGHESVVQLLVMRNDVSACLTDREGRTPLSQAAKIGHTAIVRLLLRRPDVLYDAFNINLTCPIFCAAENGHGAVVMLLLDHGFEASLNSVMRIAGNNGHLSMVRMLWSQDKVLPDIKEAGATLLSWAVRECTTIVTTLLTQGDEAVDQKDKFGRTPLSWAAEYGREQAVRLLLEHDDVAADSRDYCGRTPLSWASRCGHVSIVKRLLSRADVDPGTKDDHGRDAFSWARKGGNSGVVKLLLQREGVRERSLKTIRCGTWGRRGAKYRRSPCTMPGHPANHDGYTGARGPRRTATSCTSLGRTEPNDGCVLSCAERHIQRIGMPKRWAKAEEREDVSGTIDSSGIGQSRYHNSRPGQMTGGGMSTLSP
ncbi:hypothetical protein PCL_12100 [Purpureocillium lilacinum]|uniref:protein S-acyltransferase n=1 Tax=Purpureocillium lilacinum TaxID=33203 RepID=A0A2U3DPG7_PURLI|nr:hypothetical protein PCL_12100 [Purpureocillium lilacinum]